MIPAAHSATDVPASTAIYGLRIADSLLVLSKYCVHERCDPDLDPARVTEFPDVQDFWLAGEP